MIDAHRKSVRSSTFEATKKNENQITQPPRRAIPFFLNFIQMHESPQEKKPSAYSNANFYGSTKFKLIIILSNRNCQEFCLEFWLVLQS